MLSNIYKTGSNKKSAVAWFFEKEIDKNSVIEEIINIMLIINLF